jgi:hypothetical protein
MMYIVMLALASAHVLVEDEAKAYTHLQDSESEGSMAEDGTSAADTPSTAEDIRGSTTIGLNKKIEELTAKVEMLEAELHGGQEYYYDDDHHANMTLSELSASESTSRLARGWKKKKGGSPVCFCFCNEQKCLNNRGKPNERCAVCTFCGGVHSKPASCSSKKKKGAPPR